MPLPVRGGAPVRQPLAADRRSFLPHVVVEKRDFPNTTATAFSGDTVTLKVEMEALIPPTHFWQLYVTFGGESGKG